MRNIKVGVIGAGYWGPNLLRNFDEIPEADLCMVCDQRVERLEHIKGLYPYIGITQNFHDLLRSDVEAIAIATPVSTHYRLAMECLKARKHVLIEKPLTNTSGEAGEIVRAGKRYEKIVMAGHTFLYNPAVIALKKIIDSGEIGRVYYVNATRVNLGLYQPDVNVVWDLAPHDVSILLYILGMRPNMISARGGMYVKPGVHDVAYVSLYFDGGLMADIRVSWLDPNKIRQITIVGSKKMLVYDDIEPTEKVKIYDKGIDIQPYNDTYEEFQLAYRYGSVTAYPLDWQEPLRLECQDFLACIAGNLTPRSDGEMGQQVVQILEAAQASLNDSGILTKVKW